MKSMPLKVRVGGTVCRLERCTRLQTRSASLPARRVLAPPLCFVFGSFTSSNGVCHVTRGNRAHNACHGRRGGHTCSLGVLRVRNPGNRVCSRRSSGCHGRRDLLALRVLLEHHREERGADRCVAPKTLVSRK